jgi:predicted AlkP superfamily phosphohydrolase/phosphomutase/tetratricopeptide (TPR) repeat protein
MNDPKTNKFILIGWDAADWKILNPLLDAGMMPNLEKLISQGVIGNLATLDPAYSPMLWTSIATGKRPYKHGILGFTEVSPDKKRVRPVLSSSRRVCAIWDILSKRNLKTHVVGWWPSHPAEAMNGICISNMFQKHTGGINDSWPMPAKTVYPESMATHFSNFRVHPEELTYEHILPFVPEAARINQKKDKRLLAIMKITAHAASLHAAFTNIIRTQEWNFAALYLDSIDHYCHGFMRFHPPKRPHIPQATYDIYKDVVTAGYRFHDMMLGRILSLAGEDTTIMLISDHGFHPDHLRPDGIPKEPAGPAYEHSPYGILCLKGKGIKKDEIVYGASLLDITPTILSLFGLPTADDMDGKVLLNVFDKPIDVDQIPSWENTSTDNTTKDATYKEDINMEEQMLDQLEALGYIEKQRGDLSKRIKKTEDECQFNLAKSYLDGGKRKEAIPILEKLYNQNPGVSRYAIRLATCYQSIGELKKCREVIDKIRKLEIYEGAVLDILEGSLLMGEKQPLKALKLLKSTEDKVPAHHSRLYYQIAVCYVMLKRWKDAERALKKELELDYDHALAHQLLGSVYLNINQFTDASNEFLISIGLYYNNPHAHIQLGHALFNLGNYTEAAEALEVGLRMMPANNNAREFLVDLYRFHLNKPEKASEHEGKFASNIQGTIYIVSGLPRSGTSMMMQMIQAGGIELYTDGKRAADENNPKGYYEHELTKSLTTQKKWLHEARNKGVKVIANLLPQLPAHYNYKIIFMERNLHQIIASQRKMLVRMGKKTKEEVMPLQLLNKYEETLKKIKLWASENKQVDILYVKHQDVIENAFSQSIRINEFLDYLLLPELMAQAVDENLYRQKEINSIV